MRFSRRVVRTAALIRDRPAEVVRSVTHAFCLRTPHSPPRIRHTLQVGGADTAKSIRHPHRPVPGVALVPNGLWHIVVLRILRVSPPAGIS